jgi:Spore coat polysaccharide biosynthesis protein, predicted glycosyltransferase
MKTGFCLVIPAIKKNAVIPDQLVKKLAGITLIQRALDTAKKTCAGEHIHVITDSDEIRLICERNGVNSDYDPGHAIPSINIVASLRPFLVRLAAHYERIIIYRASSPLINEDDIAHAYEQFVREDSDGLVTVKSVKYRLWKERNNDLDALLFNSGHEEEAYIETKALFMLRSAALSEMPENGSARANGAGGPEGQSSHPGRSLVITPYFLNDRSVEINSYQDWWICEKLLQSKHIVFVVAGYPAIGMGHIYRAVMLAHEISDHRITFLCTRESALAARNLAARDCHTKTQQGDSLAADVLRLKPDLVINDILDTPEDYMRELKNSGIPVANFEDEGPGAAHADLIINALYSGAMNTDPHYLYGFRHFCLRDEFVLARRREFSPALGRVLVTFGGTDVDNFTLQTLETILPLCRKHNIAIAVVTGPGYAHIESLSARIAAIAAEPESPPVEFTHATNVMSSYMEHSDIAICSAGRTVYELTHMRVPAVVMAHHEREDMHSFARPRNGFLYLGIMNPFRQEELLAAFAKLLDAQFRKELFLRQSRFDFSRNKTWVMEKILALLGAGGQA